MSERKLTYLRTKSTRIIHSSISNNETDEAIVDKNPIAVMDSNIYTIQTSRSLDDLLDVDDSNNENDDNDGDDDSTHLSIDDLTAATTKTTTTIQQTRQKKSIKRNGKI